MNILKNKNIKLFKHGFVMFSKAGRINHPHIIKGFCFNEDGNKQLISVNATHKKNVRGHKTKMLKNGLAKEYLVSDCFYIRDSDKYFLPPNGKEWYVSRSDDKLAKKIIKNKRNKILN